MKIMFITFALLLFISKTYSQENTDERWEYIGQSKEKEKYYIDIKTQYSTDDVLGSKEVWIKCESPVKKITKSNGKTFTYYNVVCLTLHEINCSKNEMKLKQEITYDSKGKLLDTWDNGFASFKKVVPGTIGEMIMEESCKVH